MSFYNYQVGLGSQSVPMVTCSCCKRLFPFSVFFNSITNQYTSICQQCQSTNYHYVVSKNSSSTNQSSISIPTNLFSKNVQNLKRNQSSDVSLSSMGRSSFDTSISGRPSFENSASTLDPTISVSSSSDQHENFSLSKSSHEVVPRSSWIAISSKSSKLKKVKVFDACLVYHRSSVELDCSNEESDHSSSSSSKDKE